MGGRITLERERRRRDIRIFDPASGRRPCRPHYCILAPDLTGKAIMLVATQTIEASLIARRLERWGAQTCTVSDPFIANALLPERSWHAVLVDHMIGEEIETLGEAAFLTQHIASRCSRRLAAMK